MHIKTLEGTINVVEAAKIRIKNAFATGVKIYFSFSCGKDSLCLSNLLYEMILSGDIDRKQLTVMFIDEEGLYDSMVDAAMRWRKKFVSIGVPFLWFCLPFKQVSVIDKLSASESWITWEPGKEDSWIRKPPDFAIFSHPLVHYAGEMNYQTFGKKFCGDGVNMVGLRATESLQRQRAVASMDLSKISPGQMFYPIYDWKNTDVWMYIRDHNLEFPEIYMTLYEAGVTKGQLRLCAFFGDNGTQGLRWIAQTEPELWERIEKREPNAYLVLLYWDSEMFRRSGRNRKKLEEDQEVKDYKALCEDLLFRNTDKYTIPADTVKKIGNWRSLYIKTYGEVSNKLYQQMYEGILYGDPKNRVLRALWTKINIEEEKRILEEVNA